MINICTPVAHNCDNFSIDDVPIILDNIEEFIIPFVTNIDTYPIPNIDIQLCKWDTYIDDTYLSINLLIDLNNIQDYTVRVNEGFYCDTNKRIIDTDGFLDIKTDTLSISQAINDIHHKNIPLINRVKSIDYNLFPYAVCHNDDY
jgi:hypothetical protein